MANKETLTLWTKNANKRRKLKHWLAVTSAAALLVLGANSCSDWPTKQQDKDEARAEIVDKKQTNQDAVQPATVNFSDVEVEPKEPPKPENEKWIENSDEAKSAIRDYVAVLSKLNIKWVPNFEGVKKLSKDNFDKTYNWQWGEYVDDNDIKKDKDWEYYIVNWKKLELLILMKQQTNYLMVILKELRIDSIL